MNKLFLLGSLIGLSLSTIAMARDFSVTCEGSGTYQTPSGRKSSLDLDLSASGNDAQVKINKLNIVTIQSGGVGDPTTDGVLFNNFLNRLEQPESGRLSKYDLGVINNTRMSGAEFIFNYNNNDGTIFFGNGVVMEWLKFSVDSEEDFTVNPPKEFTAMILVGVKGSDSIVHDMLNCKLRR